MKRIVEEIRMQYFFNLKKFLTYAFYTFLYVFIRFYMFILKKLFLKYKIKYMFLYSI